MNHLLHKIAYVGIYFIYAFVLYVYIKKLLDYAKESFNSILNIENSWIPYFIVGGILIILNMYFRGSQFLLNFIVSMIIFVMVSNIFKQRKSQTIYLCSYLIVIMNCMHIFVRGVYSLIMDISLEALIKNKMLSIITSMISFIISIYLFRVFKKLFEISSNWMLYTCIDRLKLVYYLLFLTFVFSLYTNKIYYIPGNEIYYKYVIVVISIICVLVVYFIVKNSLYLSKLIILEKNVDTLYKEIEEYSEKEKVLEQFAYIDSLTGCFNDKYAKKIIEYMFENKFSFVLIFIDLDGLKVINDSLGHSAGDSYITTFVNIIRDNLDEEDILFRYGGDEFLLILNKKDRIEGIQKMHFLLNLAIRLSIESNWRFQVSFSYGVVEFNKFMSDNYTSYMSLIEEADAIMYEHKISRKKERN